MDATKFARIAESLRQYRRAELKDFEAEISTGDPVDTLYVDPLHGEAVLNTMLSSSTTFISGRKGTGKSTVFAKAQSRMRERKDLLSVYVDVKALYDTVNASEVPLSDVQDIQISADLYRSHMLRKSFLAAVISELVTEIKKASENMSLWDRWTGRQWDYNQLVEKLSGLAVDVKKARLSNEEVPILKPSIVYSFLAKSQTIRCADCGASFSVEERDKFEFFGWSCPQCKVGKCSIVVLGKEFEAEVQALNEDLMLESVELEILDVLNDEGRRMRAKEISALINTTYQMVGKRTTKLQQMDLVHKDDADGDMKSKITEKAKSVYFDSDHQL